MAYINIIKDIEYIQSIKTLAITENYSDELYVDTRPEDFFGMCFGLHELLNAPVMMLFASDERAAEKAFLLQCVFLSTEFKKWFVVRTNIPADSAKFKSLAKEIFSASLFEREIKEMFGIEPEGNPDLRRLNLHDEVWPEGFFPLRKDFKMPGAEIKNLAEYRFKKIEGEGIFEVPVGPVHAGIIGPGHFRFSAAGEPIINLEIRLGFTHRGVEKIFEKKEALAVVNIAECVSGDAVFSHSTAFCSAIEKIYSVKVPQRAAVLRSIFLELERMYNHVADIGGMAVDVGFTFPNMYASIIKENLLALNEKLTGSRYLKNVNTPGGVKQDLNPDGMKMLSDSLESVLRDFTELKNILFSSTSFMDRVDKTGILRKDTALDFGVVGLAARASGIGLDLRKVFGGIYNDAKFKISRQRQGDALARLNVRCSEFEESIRLIKEFLKTLKPGPVIAQEKIVPKAGFALGFTEGWRGPVFYWIKTNESGQIERCKIVDPSFHNWQALSYAVLGNIIPDFPLCNKSFNLSYPGNDL